MKNKSVGWLKARRESLRRRWSKILPKDAKNPATIENIAEMIGVSGPTLWRWENGKAKPHNLFVQSWHEMILHLERQYKEERSRYGR